jgi:hypothetical protein
VDEQHQTQPEMIDCLTVTVKDLVVLEVPPRLVAWMTVHHQTVKRRIG